MRTCSIIIPTHNRLDLVREAVASALAALPEGGEVLVIDDGSTSPVSVALADLAVPALRVLVNPNPGSAASARNFGTTEAVGQVLFFLDDDDRMVQGYPAAILALRQRQPDLVWGHSAVRTTAALPRAALVPGRFGAGRLSATLPFRRRLAGLGCGFWILRDTLVALGGIAENLPVNEDTDLSIRLIASGVPAWVSDEPGVELLEHGAAGLVGGAGQITRRTDPATRADCFQLILRRNHTFLSGNAVARKFIQKRLLKMIAKTGDRGRGRAVIAGERAVLQRLGLMVWFQANLWLYRLR
jgi:Glycosyl transferase family 2